MGKVTEEVYFPRSNSNNQCTQALVQPDCTTFHQNEKKRPQKKSWDKEFTKNKVPTAPTDPALTGARINHDDLIFLTQSKQIKQKKRRTSRVTGAEMAQLVSGQLRKNAAKDFMVDTLNYESISEGLLSLGIVTQIRDHEMLISLPGRTVGSVQFTSISQPYTKALEKMAARTLGSDEIVYHVNEMFEVGQVVSVKVTSVDRTGPATRVQLSLDPQLVNGNYTSENIGMKMVLVTSVESREDHGYVMNIGVKGVRAFLPFPAAESYVRNQNRGRPLGIGQLIMCKVTHVNTHRLASNVTLTANQKEVKSTVVPDELTIYDYLLPGMLVKTTVLNAHKTGVKVYFLELGGLIHQDHMQDSWYNPMNHELASTVVSRVLYIMPNGTRPYLTMRQRMFPGEVMRFGSPNISAGDICSATVVRFEKRGLIVRFPNGEKGIVALQRCSDDLSYTEEDILRDFPADSVHNCRVIQYSVMDNIFIGSFQASMLKDNFMNINQLKVGQVVNCQLQRWNNGGALVTMGKVKGFIPTVHFSIVPCIDLKSRYTPGMKFKARIFKLDLASNKVILTARKPLVKTKRPVIASLEDAEPGMVADGIIHRVSPAGLLIATLGGYMGFIPASKTLSPTLILEVYTRGQLVKFKVVEVNPEKEQLILSLKVDDPIKLREITVVIPKLKKSLLKKLKLSAEDRVVDEKAEEEPGPSSSVGRYVLRKSIGGFSPDRAESDQPRKKRRMSDPEKYTAQAELQPKLKRKSETVTRTVQDDQEPGPSNSQKRKSSERKKSASATTEEETVESTPGKKKKGKSLQEEVMQMNLPEEEDKNVTPKTKKSKKTNATSSTPSQSGEVQVNGHNESAGRKKKKLIENEDSKLNESEDDSGVVPLAAPKSVNNFWGVQAFATAQHEEKAAEDDDSEDEDEETEPAVASPVKKVDRVTRAKAKEVQTRKKELALADPDRKPQSTEEFNCLVMGSPNSSICWIQFMSFYLESANIKMAREVALKALKIIAFNEDVERMNVWVALLNLENTYGSEESVKETFKKALINCDVTEITFKMAKIYTESQNFDEAENVLRTLLKKKDDRHELDTWTTLGDVVYRNNKIEEGRALFARAFKTLDKRNHVELTIQFAKMEFRAGNNNQARIMLEQMLDASPNRIDLWILSAKLLAKFGDIESARSVYSRACEMSFPVRKMRSLLQAYLEFEKVNGTPESQREVGQKAIECTKRMKTHEIELPKSGSGQTLLKQAQALYEVMD